MNETESLPELAQLPMYDWPEFTEATDRLWISIRDNFSKAGIDAPCLLDRTSPPTETWRSPKLLLSQTCGLPLVTDLSGKVKVLGSFAYEGVEPAGSYYSVIIANAVSDESPVRLEGKRAVINGNDSYSGCLALKCFVTSRGIAGGPFASLLVSGSHRASLRAVANGGADIAAIDCISWHLAKQCEPVVKNLKVIAHTERRPGLPLITHGGASMYEVSMMRNAFPAAVDDLDEKSRAMLGIRGFVSLDEADYAPTVGDLRRCGSNALVAET
ncbi:MAG TPA: phosphate ABC transporter substrate-binding protein [Gammaproteobacteria bacterium]|nr:phosphate ABC transporter substrate-binding protein [Gammaproteobacteria bacterium]